MHRAAPVLPYILVVLWAFVRLAAGQCPLQWQPGDPIPFVYGDTHASTLWDADGAGPAPAVLVVGGRFSVGSMAATAVAAFDGAAWSALGTPPLAEVDALVIWNGLLVAAGGDSFQSTVATWDGSVWSVIGSVNGRVNCMVVFQGELFVGGLFSATNGVFTRSIAKWNGTAWTHPGQGVFLEVMSMAVFGSLYVGGSLSQAGTGTVGNLAIWDGVAWSSGPTFDAPVRCLAARLGPTAASSFLFAGGDFSFVGGVQAQRIARFSSSTGAWSALPGLPLTSCRCLHLRSTGLTSFQLHAAVGGSAQDKVWRLNGTTWSSLGPGHLDSTIQPTSLAYFNGQPVVTLTAPPNPASPLPQSVGAHDGTSWQPVTGPGFDRGIEAIAMRGNELVVAGEFQRYGSTSLAGIAIGNPGAWQPLGSGIGGGIPATVCVLPNGDVIVGGSFSSAGGVAVSNLARWNGSNWSPLGTGTNGSVRALLALPSGEVVVGGSFTTAGGVPANRIARWNGVAWSAMGSGFDSEVSTLARSGNGDVLAGGAFTTASGAPASRIARWNGVAWSAMGSGLDDNAYAIAALPDGHLVVGGAFTTAGGVFSPAVARWNGTTWLAQSTPATAWDFATDALAVLPTGEYFAAGPVSSFGLLNTDANVARHLGGAGSSQWAEQDILGLTVNDAVVRDNGDVVFAGQFEIAGGLASRCIAVLRPACPATAVSYGSGCAGSGGTNSLAATSLPWAGSGFQARATGMPANGIVVAVTGFAPLSVPLGALLPQGLGGCTLLAQPDLLDVALPAAGVATTTLAVPATTSLAGQTFRHQVVPFEFDLVGNLLAISASNALTMTIGVL